ncbi:MAG: maleylacetate reductase [Pseudomonadota bacterium]
MSAFTYTSAPHRIVFGSGTLNSLTKELRGAGCKRSLVLSTPFQKNDAEELAAVLGSACAGVFANAAMHTPVEVTEQAIQVFSNSGADSIVAYGGGSTVGLGKALAFRTGCTQIVIPTTYAGSEVTPILGQTENGKKTTTRDPKILPDIVIYDPKLSATLPVKMSIASGLNAMAHAVEALYAKDRNPISSLMANEGLRSLKSALKSIYETPDNEKARSEALYGAWLCGSVLGAVGMSLHHKLCHTLGGSFDLPHAETHAILLPHTAAYNQIEAKDELKYATKLFGGNLGSGLHSFAQSIEAPLALADLGMPKRAIDTAAKLATENPYWNPRQVDLAGIHDLLTRAWEGIPPEQSKVQK